MKPEFVAEVVATENVIFKRSPIHGIGGFARRDLKQGTLLIEYLGRKITKAESLGHCEAGNVYIFSLDDQHDLDGNVPWNPARFINHSCAPNSEPEDIGGRMWVVALRDIQAGEEITYNYGYDLEDYRSYPCRCGAPNCCGYIVAEALRDAIQKPGAV
jgi:hypothetical protein